MTTTTTNNKTTTTSTTTTIVNLSTVVNAPVTATMPLPIATVVGVAVGVLLLIIIMVAIAIFLTRCRQSQSRQHQQQQQPAQPQSIHDRVDNGSTYGVLSLSVDDGNKTTVRYRWLLTSRITVNRRWRLLNEEPCSLQNQRSWASSVLSTAAARLPRVDNATKKPTLIHFLLQPVVAAACLPPS